LCCLFQEKSCMFQVEICVLNLCMKFVYEICEHVENINKKNIEYFSIFLR
jgi:hypothetical protein